MCNFVVTYDDGRTYEGVYELRHISADGYPSLERCIRQHCEYSAGWSNFGAVPEDHWDRYLDLIGDETQESFAKFLEEYVIGTA